MSLEIKYKRLYYQSHHRGTKELDYILGRFADAHLKDMSEEELDTYSDLLDVHEATLYDWLLDRTPVDPVYDHEIFQQIKASL